MVQKFFLSDGAVRAGPPPRGVCRGLVRREEAESPVRRGQPLQSVISHYLDKDLLPYFFNELHQFSIPCIFDLK